MSLMSIGDLAQNLMLRRQTTALKLESQTAAKELSTGQASDTVRQLRGDISRLAGLETTQTRLSAFQTAAKDAAMTTSAMQQVLSNVSRMTQDIGNSLLSAGTLGETGTMNAVLQDADQRFSAVISSFNTRFGEESLFAGAASDRPALASAEDILSALETAIIAAGAGTAEATETAIDAWFEDPAGYESIAYVGGPPPGERMISPDDRVEIGFTALDPAIRNTVKALATAALVHRENISATPQARAQLSRRSGELLMQSQAERAALAGRIGISEARIDEASTRNESESNALQVLKYDLLGVDAYDAATRMETAQNQLETLYAVTARLSRLSLVDFLR